MEDDAVDLFKEILQFGGQAKSSRSASFHLLNIMSMMVKGEDDFREEGYMQVIKQCSSGKI